MDIILKEDIDQLGSKNDIVSVKTDMLATLIPQGAIVATESAKKIVAEGNLQQSHKAAKALRLLKVLLSH